MSGNIVWLGSGIGTHALTSTSTFNFSSLLNSAGSAPTLAFNDLVIATVFQAAAATRTTAQLTPSGYTAIGSAATSTDTNVSSILCSYKWMGTTPDTSIAIPASAATTSGIAYGIYVFRNVDSIINDVTAVPATGGNSAQPNPGLITPVKAGTLIFIAAGGAMAAGAAPQATAPTGLDTTTNAYRQTVLTTTTNDPGLACGIKSDWSSGSFDCPALTGFTTTNTGSWAAITLALQSRQLRKAARLAYFTT